MSKKKNIYKEEYFALREMAKELCIALTFDEYSNELGHDVSELDAFNKLNNYINNTLLMELEKD